MKEKPVDDHGLPSVEETKLGNILNGLPEEVQDVKESILQISQKYRQDLTNQLESSYQFELHLARNFKKINKKSKRLYQKSESLNSSLNKRLDQLKSYNELSELSTDITNSIFGIIDSLTQIELILPYNERLGVKDSPHRTHYPNLYMLLNPNDDDTLKDQDDLSSFEQLEAENHEDYNDADESSNAGDESYKEEEEHEELQTVRNSGYAQQDTEQEDSQSEIRSVGHPGQIKSDTIKSQKFKEEDEEDEEDEDKGLLAGVDDIQINENEDQTLEVDQNDTNEEELYSLQEGDTQQSNNSSMKLQEDDLGDIRKISEDTKHKETESSTALDAQSIHSENVKKQQELESVIDNYTSSKVLKQEKSRSQSMKSFRPVRSSKSIPSPKSAGVIATTGLSTNNEFPQSINTSMTSEARGTIVSASSPQRSALADNLKKFINSNKSGESFNP